MELRRSRGVATHITYPLKDASGNLVTGVTVLRPQYATFTDAAPISTLSNIAGYCEELGATGIYYSSLSAAEMAHDYIYVIASATSGDSKRLDILINCTKVASVQAVSDTVTATISSGTGSGQVNLANGRVGINWADIANATTTQALTLTTIASVSNVATVNFVASVSAAVLTNVSTVTGVTNSVGVREGTGSNVFSLTNGRVGINWTNIINATSTQGFDLTTFATATHIEDLTTTTYPEPAAVTAATATLKNKIGFLQLLARNKVQISSVTQVVFDDAEATTVTYATHTDSAGLFTKHEWR